MEEVQTITVFYSWQSDLDAETNSRAIRKALKSAKAKVENSYDNIIVNVDEATKDTSGSPEISAKILEKISNCDIFVCDISIINSESTSERKTPNPNVLIELGYAIAILGFERIIMLFNENYGVFNDLPFDLERRRITKVKINESNLQNGITNLSNTLNEAIKVIIVQNPPKGNFLEDLDPEKVKRERDIRCLNRFLEMIHFKTLKDYLIGSPDFVEAGYFLMILNLFYVYKDFDFSINDVRLEVHMNEFYTALMSISPFFQYYKLIEGTDKYAFDDNVQDAFDVHKIIKNNNKKTEVTFRLLLSYIKEKYIEIDTDETNKIAQSSVKNTAILLAFTALRR